jgi:AcrR family transcriptional regulator
MSDSSDPENVNEEIMEATYHALSKHGYPNTSISMIADEFEKSRSLLYYHYEDKEDLLEDFLTYLLDQLEADLDEIDTDDPEEHLFEVVDRLLPEAVDDETFRFRRAILEIRSQAPYHETYHDQFERSDELFMTELVDTIERGIEEGQFRAVNSNEVADFIYSAAYGALERGVTLEDPEVIERNRAQIDDYIESQLLKYA